MNYKISHPNNVINCKIDLPASKSISNRLLIIQALCEKKFKINNLSNSDDTILLQKALHNHSNKIDIGASGTSLRFLTSYLAILEGKEYILTGSKRIQERPIKDLVNTLNNIGSKIKFVKKTETAPLHIIGQKLLGGVVKIKGDISSQFISSLLLIAPTLQKGLEIIIEKQTVSTSYIQMTLKIMREFGVSSIWKNNKITVKPQKYIAKDYTIESDWSSAAFWFEIGALSKECNITLTGLNKESFQGDSILPNIFSNIYLKSKFDKNVLTIKKINQFKPVKNMNLIDTPDLYQPIKCTLDALNINTKITGITTLKNKETDRINAVDNELQKLRSKKVIKTYKDHRMAMSFAPLCLKYGALIIEDINVVTKSYPNFWEDLKKARFIISESTLSN